MTQTEHTSYVGRAKMDQRLTANLSRINAEGAKGATGKKNNSCHEAVVC